MLRRWVVAVLVLSLAPVAMSLSSTAGSSGILGRYIVVLNNSAMAIERHALVVSHDRYRTRDIGGNYADLGRAMGGQAERVTKPADIIPALQRAGPSGSSTTPPAPGRRAAYPPA